MHLGVTVGTSMQHQLRCRTGIVRREIPTTVGIGWMATFIVTGLAQERRTRLEQRGNVGPVRGVAVDAIVGDRRVLKEEWTAFFRMAGVAGLVDTVLGHQLGCHRTMGIVAIGTRDFARFQRMGGDAQTLGPLDFVALEADFTLGAFAQHQIIARVHGVAGGAGILDRLMLAARPEHPLAPLMTTQAGLHLNVYRGGGLGSVDHIRLGAILGPFGIVDMFVAGAVTPLTTTGALVGLDHVWGFYDRQDGLLLLFVMTVHADRIPLQHLAIQKILTRFQVSRRPDGHRLAPLGGLSRRPGRGHPGQTGTHNTQHYHSP